MATFLLQNRRIRIGLYMLIALSFSYLFRINPPRWYQDWNLPVLLEPFQRLLGALGIFVGAVVVESVQDIPKRITVTGTSLKNSWLMIALPVLLFTIIGVPNDQVNAHAFGLAIGLQALLWVFLEEYGWRKYLHNELSDIKPVRRYLIVGVLWYIWHLWFLRYNILEDPLNFSVNMLVGLAIIMSASWGLGIVADKTKSTLASACFHMLGSFVQFNPIITEHVGARERWIIFGICLVFWVFMLTKWIRSAKVGLASAPKIATLVVGAIIVLAYNGYSQTIRGKVVGERGQCLAYVNVGVIAQDRGTVSDVKGRFALDLSGLANQDTVLFSIVGYKKAAYQIKNLRQPCPDTYTIALVPEVRVLEPVMVSSH